MDRVGSLSRRLRSLLLLFPMLQLCSVSNGPSGEPVAPTKEFIIVISNVAASQCFEWTEWGGCHADCGEQGQQSRRRSCDYGGGLVTKFEYEDCVGPCTST